MIPALLISVLIPFLIGFLLLCCLWPGREPLRPYLLIFCFLATGLGLGVCSCIFFFWLIVNGQSSNSFIVIEAALIVCLAALLYRARARKGIVSSSTPAEQASRPTPGKVLVAALCIAAASAAISSVRLYLGDPHGQGDAVSVWNMRARFIFRGGSHWKDGFSTLLSHPDYPLLLPLSVARCWQLVGNDSTAIPALLAFLFTFSIIGLVASCLFMLRSSNQGLLAALLLLGTPFLIRHAASQYADIPLAFFLLAAVALFCIKDALCRDTPNLIALAGMAAGFSAWTKNEGLLFLASLLGARFLALVAAKRLRAYVREVIFFSAGFGLPALALVFFKTQLSPPNDVMSAQGWLPTFAKLATPSRYYVTLKAFVGEAVGFGGWPLAPLLLLLLYPLVVGIKVADTDKPSVVTAFSTLGFILAGYFFIFVITPEDLTWHLSTSLDRLLLQVWPTFVLTYFLVARPPEPAASI